MTSVAAQQSNPQQLIADFWVGVKGVGDE